MKLKPGRFLVPGEILNCQASSTARRTAVSVQVKNMPPSVTVLPYTNATNLNLFWFLVAVA
jgi:hypothetical protein